MARCNEKFMVPAAQKDTAFRPAKRKDLHWVLQCKTKPMVANDNTVAIGSQDWQLGKTRFRTTLSGCSVTIHEHLEARISIPSGPNVVHRYEADGRPVAPTRSGTPADKGHRRHYQLKPTDHV